MKTKDHTKEEPEALEKQIILLQSMIKEVAEEITMLIEYGRERQDQIKSDPKFAIVDKKNADFWRGWIHGLNKLLYELLANRIHHARKDEEKDRNGDNLSPRKEIEINGAKCLDVLWYGRIGIVKVVLKTKEIRFYIGRGGGNSEVRDVINIMRLGRQFYPKILTEFFK